MLWAAQSKLLGGPAIRWLAGRVEALVKDLNRKKIILTLAQELEWEPLFEQQRAAARDLQAQIAATDAEIDRMVYALYGLTEEEIAIVEGNT